MAGVLSQFSFLFCFNFWFFFIHSLFVLLILHVLLSSLGISKGAFDNRKLISLLGRWGVCKKLEKN